MAASASAVDVIEIRAGFDIMMRFIYHHDVRTTLTIEDDVAAGLRAEMRKSGRSFKEVINTILRLALNSPRKQPRRPFKVEARDLGLGEGLSYDNVESLLDQAEGPRRR